jgi:putative transposase
VILDISSLYVMSWTLARTENAELARVLAAKTVVKQGIGRDRLRVHMNRGSQMTAKPFVFLLADLGVTESFSRPHTCLFTGNSYSESSSAP